MTTLRGVVHGAANALRRDAFVAVGFAVVALVPVVLLAGWVIGGFPQPSLVPMLLDVALIAVGVFAVIRVRTKLHNEIDDNAVARAAEGELDLPPGALRGALELSSAMPAGASVELAERSERVLVSRLANVSRAQLTGELGSGWRRKRATALATCSLLMIAVVAAGFVTPARSRAAWAPLLHPVRNLTPPRLAPLQVYPGNASATRGGKIDVRIHAVARAAVTMHWRVQGDIAREQILPVLHDSAKYELTDLDGMTEYWVDAPDGAESAHFKITPVDPLLLSELAVDVVYPAYLGRASERYDGEVPALELPQGTELLMRGRATRALSAAALRADSMAPIPLRIADDGFDSRWVPTASGVYEWDLHDRNGNTLAVQPAPVSISIVRDAAPSVAITMPGADTVFGAELQMAIGAEAQDDHGIASVSLVTWRVSRLGVRDAPVESGMSASGTPDRLQLRTILDAGARNLTAGDTLKYFVRVRDNSPSGQVSESKTYRIVLPGMNELRDAASEQTEAVMKANADIAKAMAKLQEDTRNSERRTAASNARKSNGAQGGDAASQPNDRMQFAESQDAKRVLEEQQKLMASMEEMRAKVEALQKSLENAGLQDKDLQQKLAEMRKLFDQAMTPEMRQKMEQLKQAIDKLDPKDVEKALKELARQQELMKQQLERSMELMKRAAAEQEMNKLTQEAKELAQQQQALASQMPERKDAKSAAQQQQELAKKNDALSKEMDQLKEQLEKQGESRAASQTQKASEMTKDAQQSMQQAQQSASQGKQGDAQQDAKKAAQQMTDAAKQLDQARQQMVDGWKDETQESMQQATRDALDLAKRQQALKEQMEKAGSQPSIPKPAVPQPQVGKPQEGGQKQPTPSGQQGATPKQGEQGRSGGASGDQGDGQKQGGRQGSPPGGTSGQPQPGAPGAPNQPQSQPQPDLQGMRSEQAALQQGLQQLSRNLQDTGDRSAQVNRDVGSSLSRANQSMQQTQDALQQATPDGQLPSQEAGQTVDALNKLALSLLKNSQDVQQSKDGSGMQQAMEQLNDLAKEQGSLNGRGSSMTPMNISQSAMADQVRKLGQSQQQIAQQLDGVGKNVARDDLLARVQELAKEAALIAREMETGRLEPQTQARQEKLFHKLLDAGRSLEKDEVSQERVSERPGTSRLAQPAGLDPKLFQDGTRFRAPTPAELNALPPAYRKLILDYFERLNHPAADKSK